VQFFSLHSYLAASAAKKSTIPPLLLALRAFAVDVSLRRGGIRPNSEEDNTAVVIAFL
jgi:hypothetical protein